MVFQEGRDIVPGPSCLCSPCTGAKRSATMTLLFQGGVEFPTGGESARRPGAAARVRCGVWGKMPSVWVCGKGAACSADEPANPSGIGLPAGRFGEIPGPTVRVRMEEAGDSYD